MNETQNGNNLESPQQVAQEGDKFSRIWQKFCDWVWQTPKQKKVFGLGFLRGFLRIIFIVVRESQHDRITLRASALTFTVVLSLVPMLALGTAVLKGLGAGDQMRQAAYTFIEQFAPGPPETTTVTPDFPTRQNDQTTKSTQPALADNEIKLPVGELETEELTSHLQRAVDQIFDYVDHTDFTTLGTFGIIGMVLAALGVLGSIEQSMNVIWQTTTGRALGRKIIDYMALDFLYFSIPKYRNLVVGKLLGQKILGS